MHARRDGYSLLEMMVVVAIMGVLMAIAVPSCQTYLVNNQVRTAAEMFLGSVMQAKAEASARNAQVQLFRTTSGPDDVETAVAVAPAGTSAPGWMVRTGAAGARTYVDGKLLAEDGQSKVDITGFSEIVIFNSLGGRDADVTTPTPVATFSFTSPLNGACMPAGPVRCLDVRITATGRAKLCDPSVSTATDPRACS